MGVLDPLNKCDYERQTGNVDINLKWWRLLLWAGILRLVPHTAVLRKSESKPFYRI